MRVEFSDVKLALICNSAAALGEEFDGFAPVVRLALAALSAAADPLEQLPNIIREGNTTMFKTNQGAIELDLTVSEDTVRIDRIAVCP